jgi:hypothetical protein
MKSVARVFRRGELLCVTIPAYKEAGYILGEKNE